MNVFHRICTFTIFVHTQQRAELTGDPDLPPSILPYRGDNMSTNSSGPLPPNMGDSYSQPSPRFQHEHSDFHIPDSDEDDSLEFTDNDAYEKVSPRPVRRRFEITSQSRGAVFETIEFRH